MKKIDCNPKNVYSCQKCQREFETTEEIKIIPNKYPLCIKCRNNVKKKGERIEFQFGEEIIILDEETKNLLENISKESLLSIQNGYLTIQKGERIVYFHRLIFEDELKVLGEEFQIHHINQNKLDNRKENLQILRKDEHYSLHDHQKYNRAYNTWCEKVYGDEDEGGHYEEFDEWLMSKGDIW